MLRSMTGFGRFEASKDDRKVVVEMKSVNHRYLELGVKIPKKLIFLENNIRNWLKDYVERGKVDIFITYENNGEGNASIKYNSALAKEYLDCYQQISEEFNIDNDVRTSYILRSPDVVSIENGQDDEDAISSLVYEAVCGAAKNLVEARATEGESLKTDLLAKLDKMSEYVDFISEKSPVIVEEYKEKLISKIKEHFDESQIDESRIAQEVVIFADKICVDEEIVRLVSHINTMKDTLNTGGTIGRRLDFIAQEMNREANTTLSKTTDADISNIAIELKTDIEKVREQIQNIE